MGAHEDNFSGDTEKFRKMSVYKWKRGADKSDIGTVDIYKSAIEAVVMEIAIVITSKK